MDWIKKHKLWSLVILYLGVGMGISVVCELLGLLNVLAAGQLMGILFWAYLFICFITIRIVERKQRNKKDEKI